MTEPIDAPWTPSDYLYAYTTSLFSVPITGSCDAEFIKSLQSDLALIENTARETSGLANAAPDRLDELVEHLESHAALFATAHGVDMDEIQNWHQYRVITLRRLQERAPKAFLSGVSLSSAELAVAIMLGTATALAEAADILRSVDVPADRFANFTCFYTQCTAGLERTSEDETCCCAE